MPELAVKLSKQSHSFEQLCDDPVVLQHIHQSLKQLAKELNFSNKEVPTAITLVKEDWMDSNLLTAALKMRRKQVNEFYKKEIKQMFAQHE